MRGLWQRLQLLVGQGVATLVQHGMVQARVLAEELVKAQRVEPYGLSYRPKPGAQVYLVFPSGDRANAIALLVGDKRYQMTLQEGEVALHDDEGQHVHLGRGGVVTVKANTRLVLQAPDVQIVSNSLTHNSTNVGDTHTHGGVTPGGSNTGAPQ